MFAQTQDLEFGQGQSRDVPDRELGPNSNTMTFTSSFLDFWHYLSVLNDSMLLVKIQLLDVIPYRHLLYFNATFDSQ